MKILDITENFQIKDPVKFLSKLTELVAARSDMVKTVTVALRTEDGFFAVASSGENISETVYEFTCGINAIVTNQFMKVTEIKSNEAE